MSDHKKPMSPELRQALITHRLATDTPSQLSDSFRHGWLAAKAVQPSQADAQDAARYRHLRGTTNWASNINNERVDVRNSPELWDSAIDAAITAKNAIDAAINAKESK